jgi:cyclomaltodextrinase
MKEYFIILILLLSILTCNKNTSYPIPIENNWYFRMDNGKIGIDEQWFASEHHFAAAQKVPRLGNWEQIIGTEYDGWGCYFTEFDYHGRFGNAALSFTGVDDNAIVWLNGNKIGEHRGANQPFRLDVTSVIQKGQNRLTVLVEDTGGGGGLKSPVEIIAFHEPEDLLKGKYFSAKTPMHPAWAENTVLYELNTRQFTPEGTFKAIEPRIQELKELGVNIIWFMPIHPIGEKNRKGTLGSYYAVKDFYGINPEFGNLDDFKRLVKLIHEAGMYVIIDLVANHTAWDNPLIKTHPEWYTQDRKGDIIAPNKDWHDVADLNYDKKELWRYMIDMMKYWIAEVGIDGYRCDVAAMVPTVFWIQARKDLDEIKPVFMLAEAETPELNAFGFDMTYSGDMYRLFNAIVQGKKSPKKIDSLLKYEYYNYPQGSMRMRFTSNHDENTWNKPAVIRMGREGAKVGAVLTCTLPGTPMVYNGQEVGIDKALEFFEKDPIEWKENEFREFYRKLLWTYRNHPALYKGNMRKLKSDYDDQIYAFVRNHQDDEVVVIVNFSSRPFSGKVYLENIRGSFVELFTEKEVDFQSVEMMLKLEPWAYLVYHRE